MTKYTNYINRRSAINLFHARRYAQSIGVSMNYMVSINWAVLGITPLESTGIFKEIKRKVCRSWRYREAVMAYNYGPFYHVEVQENPSDRPNTH